MSSYLVAGGSAILVCWFIFISIAMDASALLGVFSLVAIPLVILVIVFSGLEKLAGISCLRGVEWVGKNTLLLCGWVTLSVQNVLGIDTKVARQPVSRQDNTQNCSDLFNNIPIETEIQAAEPKLDFTAIDANDPSLDSHQFKPQIFSEFPSDGQPVVSEFIAEKSILENADLVEAAPSTTVLGEAIDSQSAFNSNDIKVDDKSLDVSKEVDLTINNMALVPPAEELNSQTITTPNKIKDQIDKHSFFKDDIEGKVNKNQDIGKEDILSTLVPELAIDEVELEIKSLFQGNQDLQQGADKTEAAEEPGSEPILPEDRFNLSIQSIIEEAEKKVSDNKGEEDTNTNMSQMLDAVDKVIARPINTQDQDSTTVDESKNPPLYSSMLSQAEQAATNLLSSFSEKLAQSFNVQKETEYHLPSIDLLQVHQRSVKSYSSTQLDEMSRSVERVLKDYKVITEVVGAYPGPIITRFELSLAPGVKVSRVSGLAKDLARAMLVTSVRVVEIIEGTPYIGLEIPNQEREMVSFREIIASEKFQQAASPITLALGKDVSGQAVVSDLAKMPHLLVAGTTGSGKSVAINTMILSMLYKATPEQVRMIMVDPKMLELSVYEGIPHLLTPVVTDMKEAQNALRWAVAEMERRYKLMSKVGVRNLEGFNQKIEDAAAREETIRDPLFQLIDPLQEGETFPVLSTLPSIVIVIDELADMMMIVGKKVEELIARLAQKARAAGIHLILATQRPSVDVLTGLIKANVPTRISFQVSSRIDSRTILDQGGAEALLGNGDMLFLPSGTSVPTRCHGAFVEDAEVHSVVDYLKTQGATNYLTEITQEEITETAASSGNAEEEDELYQDAVRFVLETGRASISSVQRRFKVGYNRAARMIDKMEEEHIVSEPEGNGSRRVLNREE